VDSDPDTLVAVRRKDVDLDTKEGREMAMLDNLTTQVNLAWDETEIQNVSDQVEGFDPGDFGWTPPDVADPTADVEVKEDDFDPDAEPVPTTCKAGDIWQLGNHRLMCGDSTKREDVAKLMNGELAHLWLTDPPYNVAIENSQGMTIQNDSMASDDFRKFLIGAFDAANSVMAKGCPFYIWFATREHMNFEGALNDVGLQVRQELIWNKNSIVL
jgi:site-specific DNA-methyltransferase (adenine-specific)